jgi:hypothetical protein
MRKKSSYNKVFDSIVIELTHKISYSKDYLLLIKESKTIGNNEPTKMEMNKRIESIVDNAYSQFCVDVQDRKNIQTHYINNVINWEQLHKDDRYYLHSDNLKAEIQKNLFKELKKMFKWK